MRKIQLGRRSKATDRKPNPALKCTIGGRKDFEVRGPVYVKHIPRTPVSRKNLMESMFDEMISNDAIVSPRVKCTTLQLPSRVAFEGPKVKSIKPKLKGILKNTQTPDFKCLERTPCRVRFADLAQDAQI